MHAKLQPQPHILGENMWVESSAREFCIFPASRTFSVVGSLDGSLVKISKKIMREEMQTGLQCTRVLQPQPQPQNLQFVPHIGQICGMEESKPQIFCGCGIACTGIHPAKCGCGRNAASRAVSLIIPPSFLHRPVFFSKFEILFCLLSIP